MAENTNTEREALLELIDAYAKARAMHALEDLYGTSQSYTAELLEKQNAARAKVVASLSLPAAGQEPVALNSRHLRKFLQALQAGEMSVSRAVEILDAWVGGYYEDSMVPPPPADSCLIADDEFPMEIVRKLRAELSAAPQPAVAAGQPLIARARDEWHEEDGPVMWWAWNGSSSGWAGEPAWCGTPLSSDWPGYHTHWTPHPTFPPAPSTEGESR